MTPVKIIQLMYRIDLFKNISQVFVYQRNERYQSLICVILSFSVDIYKEVSFDLFMLYSKRKKKSNKKMLRRHSRITTRVATDIKHDNFAQILLGHHLGITLLSATFKYGNVLPSSFCKKMFNLSGVEICGLFFLQN
jgi:hypothetical protein